MHIADKLDIEKYAFDIPEKAYKLADKFWPGPLTLVLKKRGVISYTVSAGLDTVALRMPANKIMLSIIKAAGVPLAAPSANISGSPSPTRFMHIYRDLFGKVDMLIDGGECEIGVESTVVDMVGETPRLLRPGGITLDQLQEAIGEVITDKGVFEKTGKHEIVSSPGMKYRHYAPKAKVILVKGGNLTAVDYINDKADENTGIMCFDGEEKLFKKGKILSYGEKGKPLTLANRLFDTLRKFDDTDVSIIYARCPEISGIGLAVYNRLIKASGFTIIEVDN